LVAAGRAVTVFDPLAHENARLVLQDQVNYAVSLQDCLQQGDAILIVNPCREFRDLQPDDFPRRDKPIPVIDCWRILSGKLMQSEHIDYIAVGRGASEPESEARLADLWEAERSDGIAYGRTKAV
jgi:UDPglucose 6-dehydrogenase